MSQCTDSKKRQRRSTVRIEAEEDNLVSTLLHTYREENSCPWSLEVHVWQVQDDGDIIMLPAPKDKPPEKEKLLLGVHVGKNVQGDVKSVIFKPPKKAEASMILALNALLAKLPTLVLLKLDHCNLGAEHVGLLHEGLKSGFVKELSLNGNPNKEQNFHILIRICGLRALSLKLCAINDKGLKSIAREYTHCPKNSPALARLDLACNPIFEEGCKHLASILRCDRSLQFLNLTDCKIRDEGLKTIIRTFSKCPLERHDIEVRRKLRFEYFELLFKMELLQETDEHLATLQESFAAISKVVQKYPFTSECVQEDGMIFCSGNYTLQSLNLGYCELTQQGLELLRTALTEQARTFGSEKGLKRCVLEGNIGADDVINAIYELMLSKRSPSETSLKSGRKSSTPRISSSSRS